MDCTMAQKGVGGAGACRGHHVLGISWGQKVRERLREEAEGGNRALIFIHASWNLGPDLQSGPLAEENCPTWFPFFLMAFGSA